MKVALNVQEYKKGVPEKLCCQSGMEEGNGGSRQGLFPEPRAGSVRGPPQDIAFSMVKGDFSVGPAVDLLQVHCSLRVYTLYGLDMLCCRLFGESGGCRRQGLARLY